MIFAILIYGTGLFCLVATVLPLFPSGQWWIRIFDFPRVQIAALALLVIIAALIWNAYRQQEYSSTAFSGLIILLVGTLAYQIYRIAPYTWLGNPEIADLQDFDSHPSHEQLAIRILVANLFFENENFEGFLTVERKNSPDVMLLTEIDQDWAGALTQLHDRFPHRIVEVRDDGHGIGLYSKLAIDEGSIHFLVSEERPSIRAVLRHSADDTEILVWGVHPSPPGIKKPNGERKDSRPRDAELLLLAERIKDESLPALVLGDLNDTAWSHTTTLFKIVSGLNDPRVGRGLFNTYHAAYPLLRYPIDHVFVSRHFLVQELRRLANFGSDHFPMLVVVALEQQINTQAALNSNVRPELEGDVEKIIDSGLAQEQQSQDTVENDSKATASP